MKTSLPISKTWLTFGAFLFTSLLGIHAALVIAGTVSSSDTLDVTAVVPGVNTNTGGGGSGSNPTATVTLAGASFPNAKLTFLKDGAITTTLYANSDGTFQITINNLNFGNYQFSIYAEDPQGITSNPHTVNVAAFSSQPYAFSNIVIPPTISADQLLVKIGQTFTISGYAPAGASVSLDVPGGSQFGTTVAGPSGLYQILAHATGPSGVYSLRTKANLNGVNSLYSRPVQILFFTGQPPVPPNPPPQYGVCVDYNHDKRVNLIDFSILLYWFGKGNPPNTIDCNGDTVIDIKDFSILMYFWTG